MKEEITTCYEYKLGSLVGLGRLCQHNFGNNWDFLESSIMPAYFEHNE